MDYRIIPRYQAESSWWEHVPVAHWLVKQLEPETVVELGTHYGVSLFAFCEASETYCTDTKIYGIDTWEGDSQAGFYDDNVFEQVRRHKEIYHENRCTLLRTTFEDAVKDMKDESIDILHIDGLHTYEAVKKDYTMWKDKVSKNGSILFHDWNVKDGDFGVWRLWEEIKQMSCYQCIELENGYGLGIATKTDVEPDWHRLFKREARSIVSKGKLLSQVSTLKEEYKLLYKESLILKKHINNLEIIRTENDKYIDSLTKELNVLSHSRDKWILSRLKGIISKIFRIKKA